MVNLETKKFIYDNLSSNFTKLLLIKRSDLSIDYDFAFRQIEGLQRIRHKVPTFYLTQDIQFPPKLNIEQSSSESTALYKKSLCEGEVFIDLTGGFGIDFYYISTKFERAIYVERNEILSEIVKHNCRVLACTNATFLNIDAIDFIESMPDSDCVYVDPARRDNSGGKVVFLSQCEPDITKLYPKLLSKTKQLLVKLSPMLDITAAIESLKHVQEVHIVSVANECKEILLVLKPNFKGIINFYAINIDKNSVVSNYVFNKLNETNATVEFTSTLLTYLYEPNSSVLKAGAFKMIANDYHLKKLHINTHLYTSNDIMPNFPGRIFEVKQVLKTGKKELAALKKELPKANLSTRNYPLTTEQLKKKIGIADGGDTYLFGCTLNDESKVIIECKKIISII